MFKPGYPLSTRLAFLILLCLGMLVLSPSKGWTDSDQSSLERSMESGPGSLAHLLFFESLVNDEEKRSEVKALSIKWLDQSDYSIECEHFWQILEEFKYWQPILKEAQGELAQIQDENDPVFIRRLKAAHSLNQISLTHRAMVSPFFDEPMGMIQVSWRLTPQQLTQFGPSLKWMQFHGFAQVATNRELVHDYFRQSAWELNETESSLSLSLPVSVSDICSPVELKVGFYPKCDPEELVGAEACINEENILMTADLTGMDRSQPKKPRYFRSRRGDLFGKEKTK